MIGDSGRSSSTSVSGGGFNRIDGVCDMGHTTSIRETDSKGHTIRESDHGCESCGCGSGSTY